jgi:DnaJ-class molecular chaperone
MKKITHDEYFELLSRQPKNCPACNGAGMKKEKGMLEKCEICDGEGQVLVCKPGDSN